MVMLLKICSVEGTLIIRKGTTSNTVIPLYLLLILGFTLFVNFPPVLAQEVSPRIVVHVSDQFKVPYDDVVVEAWRVDTSILWDSGKPVDGRWVSRALNGTDALPVTYNVTVYSQVESKSQSVVIKSKDVLLTFSVRRPVPPQLFVSNITKVQKAVSPGQDFTVILSVKNVAQSPALNSQLSIQVNPPFSIKGAGSTIFLGNFGPGSTGSVELSFSVDPRASSGDFPISYSLTFNDNSSRVYTQQGVFGITVSVRGIPQLVVSKIALSTQVANPGQSFKADLVISNVGTSQATSSRISLLMSGPLALVNSGSVFFLDILEAGANRSISIVISVDPSARVGSYPIGYKLGYSDVFGAAYISDGVFAANVAGAPIKPTLLVSKVGLPPAAINPGQSFKADLVISNVGTATALNTILSLKVSSPLVLVGRPGNFSIGQVGARENISVTLPMSLDPESPTGNYPVEYQLAFQDNLGREYLASGSFTIGAEGFSDVKIREIALSNSALIPGSRVNLILRLTNVGTDRASDMTVSLRGSRFVTKAFDYIGSISSRAVVNTSFIMDIPKNTTAGKYPLTINMQFKDTRGRAYNSSQPYELLVLSPGQPAVSIRNVLWDPLTLTPNMQGAATIFVSNSGQSRADNIIVRISGDNNILSSSSFHVGGVDPGSSETIVLGVNIAGDVKPGAYLLKTYISYEDPIGARYTSSSYIQLRIFPSVSFLTPINIGAIVSLVAVAIVTLPALRRHGLL